LTTEDRKRALQKLGASEDGLDALLAYTENVFTATEAEPEPPLFLQWPPVCEKAQEICETPPEYEMFESAAGTIPVIYARNTADFENLVREIVYKGREIPGIENMGASFVFGKTLRFIILSNKPYSGVPAVEMGLEEADWMEKSMVIRKYHECAHYYTKKHLGSSRNNLHDELIADFCGLFAAFGEYRTEWFMRFFKIRAGIYTKDLNASHAGVIGTLASVAANGVEAWTKTTGFIRLDEAGRIEYLAKKELLSYV
jgi:hypothetical protein